MTTTVAADDIKALRQRAAGLGCRLLKRRGEYWLLDKDDDSGAGFESLEYAAKEIGRRERGDPLTICTPCGTPLFTTDPKTGKIINHQTERALTDLSTAIKTAHEQAERALRDGLLHAIRAGELLLLD